MARLRSAFGVIATTVRLLMACIHYVRRRRMTAERQPRLQLDFIHPPYWGAEKLELSISNSGGARARNCRYCRLQAFTMAGSDGRPPSFSTQRWFSSDRLDVRSGAQKRACATLTLSPCPRGILGDVAAGRVDETTYQDAIVCQDSAGTVYRFRCFMGPNAAPDVWSPGLLDRFRGASAPAWVEWASHAEPVEGVRWSEIP